MSFELQRKIGSLAVSLLMVLGQYVPLFGLFIPNYAFAVVDSVTPSTNDINRTNGWAHVDQLSQDIGSTVLQFISTRNFYSCFEYRADGDTSQKIGDTNYNTFVTDGLYPFFCQKNNSSTHTINANEYVEIRMVFGAETDERFDWTRFDVLPPDTTPPSVPTGIRIIQNGQDLGCGNYTTQRRITVDWDDNGEEDFDHYDYRIREGTIIDHPTVSEKTEDIRDLDGYYKYSVRAVDAVGNASDWSEWCGITLDRVAPSAPEIVFPDPGQYFTSQPILNDWKDVVDNLSGLDYYRIEYQYDDGHTFSGFPYRTTLNSWRYHVPALSEQGGVKFRVQAFDNAGNEGAWSEWRHYYYDASDPWTVLTSPANGQVFSGPIHIAGISEDNPDFGGIVDKVDLFYSVSGENDWQPLVTNYNLAGDEPFSWGTDWTPLVDGTYDLKAVATDRAGNVEGTAYVYGIIYDTTAPNVKINSPSDNSYVKGIINVRGTVLDDNLSHYWLYIGGPANVVNKVVSRSQFTNENLFTWDTDSYPEGVYTIKLEARDLAGNKEPNLAPVPADPEVLGDSVDWITVTVDRTAPKVYLTSHVDGDYLSGVISIQGWIFDEPNLNNYNLALYPGHDYASTWNFSNRVWQKDTPLTNSPSHNLDTTAFEDGEYMIRLAARDKAGNRDPAANSGTGDSVVVINVYIDNTAPVVTWNNPADGDALSGNSAGLDASASDLWLTGSVTYYYKVTGADDSTLALITSPWDLSLVPLGYYTLVAQAVDLAGNLGEARIDIEIKAAVSDEAAVGVSTTSFAVSWTTDKPTTSRVVYDTVSHPVLGSAPNYGYAFSTDTFDIDPKVTSHSVFLTGLTPGTTYYFRTVSSGSPTTIGEEYFVRTGDILGEETERDEEGEVLAETGTSVQNLAVAALAFAIGILLRRRYRALEAR